MKSYFKDKKVVVTGAGGFIGSSMVEMLVKQGAMVTGCVLHTTARNIRGASYRQVNVINYEECKKVLAGQDIVLHFAGMDGGLAFKREHHAEIFRANTQMALNILEAAKENKLKRVLMISSIEVYSPDATSPILEDKGLLGLPKEEVWGYAWSKRNIEIASQLYHAQYGLSVAVARLGNIYGSGDNIQKKRVVPIFIHNVISDSVITIRDKNAKVALLSMHDVLRTLLDLTEKYAVGDPMNIVGQQEVFLTELVSLIGKLVGKNPVVRIMENLPKSKRKKFSIDKAKRILKFHENISLKDGLSEVIKNYLASI